MFDVHPSSDCLVHDERDSMPPKYFPGCFKHNYWVQIYQVLCNPAFSKSNGTDNTYTCTSIQSLMRVHCQESHYKWLFQTCHANIITSLPIHYVIHGAGTTGILWPVVLVFVLTIGTWVSIILQYLKCPRWWAAYWRNLTWSLFGIINGEQTV